MGHKVHPYGFRIGIIKPWLAKWYADRDYATLLQEDMRIRQLVAKQLSNASVSQVEIERGINHVTVTVHTAKPGIVIGKGGSNVELLRTSVGKLTDKKVKLEIKEILQPELDAVLVAQNVAGQLERRIAFRKAIKQTIQRTIKAGAKGVKIQVSGRLGGSEMSRTEWDKEGRIPLGTLRADISYGMVHAHTTYGRIGVKVWIYRGEQLGELPGSARTEPREPRARTPRARSGAASGRGRRSAPAAAPVQAATAEAAVAPASPSTDQPAATKPAESSAPAAEPAKAAATEPAESSAPAAEPAEPAEPKASKSEAKASKSAKVDEKADAEAPGDADSEMAASEKAEKADAEAKAADAPKPDAADAPEPDATDEPAENGKES
jgi:small subunit ribosomal protein S3